MSKFFTTPIFYASGTPHLGHAYSGFIADTLKRYSQLRGENPYLITGTDEFGQKIQRTASRQGIEIRQFLDNNSGLFKTLWRQLNIPPDCFVRTTDQRHQHSVSEVWQKLEQQGDIYLGNYEGLYCVECEQYYGAWQLANNCCPIHRTALEKISEPTYLFRLEKYRKQLTGFYAANPSFIRPSHFQLEIEQKLKVPFKDLSISRTNVSWGIPVPGDKQHVIYVWLDALFSYVSALKQLDTTGQQLQHTTHVIGKDILQFHAVYWLAFLLAANLPLPERLVVHGWWTIDGEKISKSNQRPNNNGKDLYQVVGSDGLRYGLFRQKPIDRDGDISTNELVKLINNDLANNLGNLIKRFATLVLKYFSGRINYDGELDSDSREQIKATNIALPDIAKAYSDCNLYTVTQLINPIVSRLNAYFQRREPWTHKHDSHAAQTLSVIYAVLNVVYKVYYPIVPELAENIQQLFEQQHQALKWPKACGLLPVTIRSAETLFQRIEYPNPQ